MCCPKYIVKSNPFLSFFFFHFIVDLLVLLLPTMPYFVVVTDPAKYTTFLQSRPEAMENQAIELVINLCREYRSESRVIVANLGVNSPEGPDLVSRTKLQSRQKLKGQSKVSVLERCLWMMTSILVTFCQC